MKLLEFLETFPPFLIRSHRTEDLDWVIREHGTLYLEEYGWGKGFEDLVANVVYEFQNNYNPERERCWIAEINGRPVASVFLVRSNETVAKLRLLLVHPSARGFGLGRHLIELCTSFARNAKYKSIELWTNSNLITARHLYEQAGYKLIRSEKHNQFGENLIGETWELTL